ncbi:ATP-binding cassette domain-containing protein [Herbidospora sp. NBRC 101105]|uniref:ATP-binding cassette domain-containing protein n=1 Tax=Herbidospora sp. NBRC 101105 TaxID=3032195 RepID=UPI0024A1ACB0|nr:ATP-binding cassette domain-containing protein [Herbidospora sp. NBRC 101105]GLX96022.1 ABC transporter ATP-binding protein [Herbidospora sp. NBRC 101105]
MITFGPHTRIGVFLWRAFHARPGQVRRFVLWSLVEAAPAFVIGLAVARAVDAFTTHQAVAGLSWTFLLGLSWIFAAVGGRQGVVTLATIVEPVREELLTTTIRGALEAGRDDPAAVTRANLQVEVARDAFTGVIGSVKAFVFALLGAVAGVVALMPELLLLVLPPLLLGLGAFLFSLPELARRQHAYLLADEATAESLVKVTAALGDIAASGDEDHAARYAGARFDRQRRAAGRLATVTTLRTVVLGAGAWAPILLVLAYAPRLGATPGVVLGTLAYVMQSLTPALFNLASGLGESGVRLWVTLARLRAALPPPQEETRRAEGVHTELKEVTFAYGPRALPVVDRLDLVIPEGEHLAVVGPSGIGKSTLAALIAGLVVPDQGRVTVGGVPAARLDRGQRVLIPQEAYVFRGTVAENLGDHDPRRMRQALDAIGAAHVKLQATELGPADRQLVALARAYLADAPLVILDEATSCLDPAAEARVEQAFAERGGTLVVVAHRISSALRARKVLVMDGTRVVAGTHQELLAASPLYADLAGHWDPRLRQVS